VNVAAVSAQEPVDQKLIFEGGSKSVVRQNLALPALKGIARLAVEIP
jgi:hypothetical protein